MSGCQAHIEYIGTKGKHFCKALMHRQSSTHGSTPELSSFTCGAPQASPGVWVDAALHQPMELYKVVLVAHNPPFIFCLVETMAVDKMLRWYLCCVKSVLKKLK